MLPTALLSRSWARPSIMWAKPRPTSPITLASGTSTSSKNSSAVSASCWPIFSSLRPRLNPAMPSSMPISVMPGLPEGLSSALVCTAQITRSDWKPLVMKVFEPLTSQPSPAALRLAVVLIAARSLPALGSVMPIAVISSPVTNFGSQRSCCSWLQRSVR